jgi:dTDP-4-amino-4,6-dideoxygalactose transaminase
MINYYNVAQQYLDCKDAIDQAVQSSMQGGQFFNNGYLDSLETKISSRYGHAHVQLTSSCTAALHAALISMDLPAGSAVAVPALTYVATAQAVLAAGHHPVFIDIDQHWLMDINDLFWQMDREHNIKAVITVDLYGQGADVYNMSALCRDKGSKLIIDAAQSFGLHSKNYNQVAASDAICLSFNPLKNLGGMGGGAIVSSKLDPTIMRAVCHEGKTSSGPQGHAEYHGLNYRMDAVAAAMLLAKFDYHERNQQRKYDICARYRSELQGLVEMPEPSASGSVHYTFSIAPQDPARMRDMLSARGIGFSSHYLRPLTTEPVFRRYYRRCGKAELLEDRIISLPCHWHLSNDEVSLVISAVKAGL